MKDESSYVSKNDYKNKNKTVRRIMRAYYAYCMVNIILTTIDIEISAKLD